MSDQLELDLDAKKVLRSVDSIAKATEGLAYSLERSLGKDAAKSFAKLEEVAERGAAKISTIFKSVGQRIKEDLGTAFDVTGVAAGLKFTNEIGHGVKSIFDLEAAFARLNTRLQLTGKGLAEFKTLVGRNVAATGQKLEDVLPGVETVASKGGLRNATQLGAIGGMLGQAKAINAHEDTEHLSDTIVSILKNQGKDINAATFKATLDALQGARVSGNFKSAAEAGGAVADISQFTGTGLSIRQMAALSAKASTAEGGNETLHKILQVGQTPGGQEQLNGLLGSQIFKNGKLDAGAIGKIDLGRLKGVSKEQMGQIAGFEGSSGSDLVRFVEVFKKGMAEFDTVAKGADETASQFGVASDNLRNKIDRFRENAREAGREIGDGLMGVGNALLKGDLSGAASSLGKTGRAISDHSGTLALAGGVSLGTGMLMGGAAKRLLGKMGGGLLGNVIGAEAAKASGVTPVYVTNASEMGGGGAGSADGFLSGMRDMATGGISKAGGFLSKVGNLGKAALPFLGGTALPLAGAAAVGGAIGYGVNQIPGVSNALSSDALTSAIGKIAEFFGGDSVLTNEEAFARAVERGVKSANAAEAGPSAAPMTNPSSIGPRGGGKF